MKNRYAFLLLAPLLILLLHGLSYGKVKWDVALTLKMDAKPLDVAIALNGKYIFVLTDLGEVMIYTADGLLKDKISVGMKVNSLNATPIEDILLLCSSKDRALKVITLDFIQAINTTGFPFKGAEDAPVVIAVFSDFQCLGCADLVPVLDQVIENYPEKVKIVFKNYPSNHKNSRLAAAAARSAEKQGKFWEFHDLLFMNYRQLNLKKIKDIAIELGLDVNRLQKDMKDKTVIASIDSDISEAARVGVLALPSVFINGRILRNVTFVGFQARIEEELNKAKTKISGSDMGQED